MLFGQGVIALVAVTRAGAGLVLQHVHFAIDALGRGGITARVGHAGPQAGRGLVAGNELLPLFVQGVGRLDRSQLAYGHGIALVQLLLQQLGQAATPATFIDGVDMQLVVVLGQGGVHRSGGQLAERTHRQAQPHDRTVTVCGQIPQLATA